jgi:hypothetical protein
MVAALVYEPMQAIGADPRDHHLAPRAVTSYGDGVSLWALGETVKAQAAFSRPIRLSRLQAPSSCPAAVGDDREAEWIERYFAPRWPRL